MDKKSSSLDDIRVGPAGWAYEDWKGIVYPRAAGRSFDPLAYLSGYFDTIEINSPFYRIPSPRTVASWMKRVRENERFRFTVKLWRAFTHDRSGWTAADVRAFREILDPLRSEDRLGALLLQFPWSFRAHHQNREYLWRLLDEFAEYPSVLEIRHASWNDPERVRELTAREVGLCNIDQPVIGESIEPSSRVTSAVGYVRLHGRNYQTWFDDKAGRDQRYDYLYSTGELEPWAERIREIARRARETFVITNNHFRGQAVVNAVQLINMIDGRKVAVPPPLVLEYPQTKEIREPEPGQTDLFDP